MARGRRKTRGKVLARAPCPRCRAQGGDGAGDNLAVYDDHTYCYACGYSHRLSHNLLDKSDDSYYNMDVEGEGTGSVMSSSAWGQPQGTQDDGEPSGSYAPWDDRYIYNNYHPRFPRNTQYPGRDAMGGGGAIEEEDTLDDKFTYQYVPHRGLTRDTLAFFDVKTRVALDGTPICTAFPYNGGKGMKVRAYDEKKFWSVGEMADAGLFGQDRFGAGSCKSVTVTEGEIDCLSAFQILGGKYAAVSIRGASSARRDCQGAFQYLNSFDQIYLCFDNDTAGQAALTEVASLFDPNKVRVVKLGKYKDANDYLQNGAEEEFKKDWWAAKPYHPKGIIGDYATISEILKKEDNQSVASYPFPTLDSMAYGIRSGELVLITAQEKIGKTEVLRAIEFQLLRGTDLGVGIIHLEESEKRSVQGLASYHLGVPCHLPDSGVSRDDVYTAYRAVTRRDGRCFLYTHFGSDDPNTILDIIRYLVAVCSCRFVFLDHLTMLVSGFEGEDERRKLDYISTRLAMLTRELNFTLFIVSHVNDDGLPRGSRMISKVCDLHIYLSRDKESADANTRNSTNVVVRDNRFGGITGPAGVLAFDPKSFTIKEKEANDSSL